MNGFDWQSGVALAIVAAAVAWLGWQLWRLLSGTGGGSCGSGACGGCGAKARAMKPRSVNGPPRELPLVSLDARRQETGVREAN